MPQYGVLVYSQGGFAFEPSTTATAIRGDTVSSGPLVESDLVAAAFFMVAAPDLEVAVRIAKAHPAAVAGMMPLATGILGADSNSVDVRTWRC